MKKRGKKYIKSKEVLEAADINSLTEALDFIIKNSAVKYDESVDVDFVLGIDPSKGEQTVRGAVLLPNGTGKKRKILVFAKGDNEQVAKDAGADFVGAEDLIEKIKGGWVDFDVAVSTPDLMGIVGKVAKILGPKGLLPNKKVGTVTLDIESIVKDLKKGRVAYRNDKGGTLHASFGRVSFGVDKLKENFDVLLKAVQSSKPPTSKGRFIKKISVSSTMGVGVSLSPEKL